VELGECTSADEDDDEHRNTDILQSHDMQVSDSYLCHSPEIIQKHSASFLLGLKEKFKLTQVSVQGVIQGVTALNHQNINSLKQQVC